MRRSLRRSSPRSRRTSLAGGNLWVFLKSASPPIKTLSGFDFSFQPSLEQPGRGAAALDFIDRHEVVHFIGQSGTGKSHLAIALDVEAVRAERSVYFSPLADIIDSLARAEREGRLRERCDSAWKKDPVLECAPAGGQNQAVVLTVRRAC
jgi:DNA replication protein DnaC